jgi:hypothetical protein
VIAYDRLVEHEPRLDAPGIAIKRTPGEAHQPRVECGGQLRCSRGVPGLPPEAATRILQFLELCDSRLPEVVEALWVEGSIALGDFHPRTSDIDIVVLTAREVPPGAQIQLRGRPPIQALWATRDRLAGLTSELGGVGAVLAATLHRHGIAVRGPHPRQLVPDVGRAELARAVLANLEAYWVLWLDQARTGWPLRLITLHPRLIAWGVAGVPRQYLTVSEDRIVSKSVALELARSRFESRWHRILDEALRLRTDGSGSLYRSPFERRSDMIAFLEYAIGRTRSAGRAIAR